MIGTPRSTPTIRANWIVSGKKLRTPSAVPHDKDAQLIVDDQLLGYQNLEVLMR